MSERSPRRRPRPAAVNPIATLLFIAAFPTVIMFGVWRYAQSQEGGRPPGPDRETQFEAFSPVTPILSARRTPTVLARETSSTAFELALRPLGGAVLPGSCAGVAVDGVVALADGLDSAVTPASTLKVIIAAVALDVLGPDYSFTTEVRAEIVGGVVGSLYLVGGGDPLLAANWYPDDANFNRFPQQPATSLDALADAVVKAGVTQIGGNVVGDPNRFDLEYYPPTWPVSFRATEGGPVAGLLVNDGRVRNQGVVATDPGLGAAREFLRLLQERGVTVVGQATSGQVPSGTSTIASVTSAPLSAIVGEMLQNSDNNTAEILLKEVGL
ncbi:MAG: putative D-alanyl-D-alanine carboxypeptidase, partial [Actinomycetota bacterium]